MEMNVALCGLAAAPAPRFHNRLLFVLQTCHARTERVSRTVPQLPYLIDGDAGALTGGFKSCAVPPPGIQGPLRIAPSWEDPRRFEIPCHLSPKDVLRFFRQVDNARASVLGAGNEDHALSEIHLIFPQGELIPSPHAGQNGKPQHVHFLGVQLLDQVGFLLQGILCNRRLILGLALNGYHRVLSEPFLLDGPIQDVAEPVGIAVDRGIGPWARGLFNDPTSLLRVNLLFDVAQTPSKLEPCFFNGCGLESGESLPFEPLAPPVREFVLPFDRSLARDGQQVVIEQGLDSLRRVALELFGEKSSFPLLVLGLVVEIAGLRFRGERAEAFFLPVVIQAYIPDALSGCESLLH